MPRYIHNSPNTLEFAFLKLAVLVEVSPWNVPLVLQQKSMQKLLLSASSFLIAFPAK